MAKAWWFWADCGPWAPFTSRGRWGRFFESGEVRLALLSLLEEGPKHGYELMKDLEARSGGLYRASAGTVYPTLQLLEDEGLVMSEQREGKKVYRLTEAGREELKRRAEEVQRIWRRAGGWEEWARWMGPEVATIAGPVAGLVKAAMRAISRHADDPDSVTRIRDILERTRRELEALANQ